MTPILNVTLAIFSFLFFVWLAWRITPKKTKQNVQPKQYIQPQTNNTLNELINEDSEGDGLMTLSEGDIFLPPEDLDEDE
jgi:hypothetical protein